MTKFAFVCAERANHAVATLCRVVGASVSGFYAWLRAIPSRQSRAEAEAELRGHIGRIFAAKRRVYGAPRIHAELHREGHRHARRRIEHLMRDMGLQASRGRRRTPKTTDSRHDLPIAPNLLGRSFTAEQPDAVWLADISYIPTGEGFMYLAAIKDMATRQIVGWSMADHLKAGLCIDALVMALERCRPPRGLIHHSDQSSGLPPWEWRGEIRRSCRGAYGARLHAGPGLGWGAVTQGRVQALPIVEHLNILEDRCLCLRPGAELGRVDAFRFERGKEALHGGIDAPIKVKGQP